MAAQGQGPSQDQRLAADPEGFGDPLTFDRTWPAGSRTAAELARARAQLNALWPVVPGFLTGTITGAFAYACFDSW